MASQSVAEYQGGYGDIFNKMLNVVGTEEAPNLVVAYQNQAATYQLADALLDMNSLVESETWGIAEEDMADFFPGFINSDVFPSFDGARLGFPPNRSMEVLYYNADWLAELGFDGPPTTAEEFKEMACAAVEQPFSGAVGDAPSMGYQLSVDASRFASWTFAFGGDVFDYDANEYSYNNEAAVEAMTFIQDLFDVRLRHHRAPSSMATRPTSAMATCSSPSAPVPACPSTPALSTKAPASIGALLRFRAPSTSRS